MFLRFLRSSAGPTSVPGEVCTRNAKDDQENALQGNVLAIDTHNSLIRAPKGKLVVVKDIQDYIIVDTDDVLLIYPKSKEQEIKQVTALVKAETGEQFL